MSPSCQGLLSLAGAQAGLYPFSLDEQSAALVVQARAVALDTPGALAAHPSGLLCAAVQTQEYDPNSLAARGELVILRRRPGSSDWETLAASSTNGTSPCSVAIDPAGRWVAVANFRAFGSFDGPGHPSRGSLCLIPLSNGRFEAGVDVLRREGSSVHPRRQTNSHPHQVTIDPGGRFLLVPDLGLDRIFVYEVVDSAGQLRLHEVAVLVLPPLSGPRHLCFGRRPDRAYLVQEIGSDVSVLGFAAGSGALQVLQTVSSIPPEFAGANTGCDIHVHPSGRFMYASNRGHDSLAIYEIDPTSGLIGAPRWFTQAGLKPADFTITPTGLLLVPTQDTVFVLHSGEDGSLSLAAKPTRAPGQITWLQVLQ